MSLPWFVFSYYGITEDFILIWMADIHDCDIWQQKKGYNQKLEPTEHNFHNTW